MHLWIERPHVVHPRPPKSLSLPDWIDTGGRVVRACTHTSVCALHMCVQLLCDRFPEPEPSPCPLAGEMAGCGERWGSFTVRPTEC